MLPSLSKKYSNWLFLSPIWVYYLMFLNLMTANQITFSLDLQVWSDHIEGANYHYGVAHNHSQHNPEWGWRIVPNGVLTDQRLNTSSKVKKILTINAVWDKNCSGQLWWVVETLELKVTLLHTANPVTQEAVVMRTAGHNRKA